jgi:hypothetical protein
VFASVDGEVDVVKDDVVAASYVDVGQMQERRHSSLGYRSCGGGLLAGGRCVTGFQVEKG